MAVSIISASLRASRKLPARIAFWTREPSPLIRVTMDVASPVTPLLIVISAMLSSKSKDCDDSNETAAGVDFRLKWYGKLKMWYDLSVNRTVMKGHRDGI